MNKWFECCVSYEKTQENGTEKKITEKYLCDALSFTEAEAWVTEMVQPFLKEGCEYDVKAVKKCNYAEIFQSNELKDDKWYKVRVAFVTLDEKSGAEKKKYSNMLVEATDLREAVKRLDEGMKGTLADYGIISVAETTILDVFMYEPEKES